MCDPMLPVDPVISTTLGLLEEVSLFGMLEKLPLYFATMLWMSSTDTLWMGAEASEERSRMPTNASVSCATEGYSNTILEGIDRAACCSVES